MVQTKAMTTGAGITLHYQDEGNRASPAIILIMGLGAQLTVWPDALYYGLVKEGFRVIRFDNRDTGLSSQLDDLGNPSLLKAWLSKKLPIRSSVPYRLEDMADDVLALMKFLKIKKAHLVGASMGGMIAQIIAARKKKKILSLTSIMSSTGLVSHNKESLKVLLSLARRPGRNNREAAIRYNIKLNRLIGGPAYPIDEQLLYKQAINTIDRAYNPAGFKRQLAAITAGGDRRKMIKKIKAPTLVIHGSHDPVIPVSAGMDTAKQIRKSRLKVIEGMGHNFPPVLTEKITHWIAKHVKKAEKKRVEKKRAKARGKAKVRGQTTTEEDSTTSRTGRQTHT